MSPLRTLFKNYHRVEHNEAFFVLVFWGVAGPMHNNLPGGMDNLEGEVSRDDEPIGRMGQQGGRAIREDEPMGEAGGKASWPRGRADEEEGEFLM